jgi:hypothetical protein
MRTLSLSVLDQVRIASPCPVKWEDMRGDERARHCDQCDLKVHNISELTRGEAEAYLSGVAAEMGAGRRVCLGFYRRADGTILTKDCPVGLAAVRAALARRWSRFAALVALVFSAVITLGRGRTEESGLKTMEPFAGIARALNPVAPFLGPMVRQQRRPVMFLGGACLMPVSPVKAPATKTK